MHHRDIAALMDGIAPVIGDYVAQAFAPLAAELKALTERLDALPAPQPVPSGDEVRRMVDEAVAKVPPAPAGKDADPELIAELVRAAVAELPAPKDGAPGASVTVEELAPLVAAEVGKAVASLPAPRDGKDADPELVAELVRAAVGALPAAEKGEPGQSVTVDDLAPLIVAEIGKAVALLPPAPAGKDADPEAVREIVKTEVAGAVALLPPAEPGPPGKDVDPAELAGIVTDLVSSAVEALPKPQDGKSVTIDDVAPLVSDLVGKAVAELPAQPVSRHVNEEGVLVEVFADGAHKAIGKVRGADGARGASVMDGDIDDDGALVLRMSDGRNVKAGIVRGADGRPGEQGPAGARGRDAIEIAIAPGIDEARAYPEGFLACWRGGIIRAERQTDPVVDGDIVAAGWRVAVNGIAEETERDLDDGRVIERTTVYTSGTTFVRQIVTATPIDRGVWREGAFRKGDGVSYGGSFFIARQDTGQADKPGESDKWRLAVKRGRNGQDGLVKAERAPPIVRIP
jgi:hypothetical protein